MRFKKHTTPDRSPEAAAYYEKTADNVRRTIDHLGLETDRAIVVGSAALALSRIGYPARTPQDVDVIVPAATIVKIVREGLITPTGVPVTKRDVNADHFNVLTAGAMATPYRTDIITHYAPDTDGTIAAYDARFHEHIDHYKDPDTGLLVATPHHMLREYTRRRGSLKARHDKTLVRNHLRHVR